MQSEFIILYGEIHDFKKLKQEFEHIRIFKIHKYIIWIHSSNRIEYRNHKKAVHEERLKIELLKLTRTEYFSNSK